MPPTAESRMNAAQSEARKGDIHVLSEMQSQDWSAPLRIQNPDPCDTGNDMQRMRILGGRGRWRGIFLHVHVAEKGERPEIGILWGSRGASLSVKEG